MDTLARMRTRSIEETPTFAAPPHAGIIRDTSGGCGILSLIDPRSQYSGTERNGMASIAFNSSFPASFVVKPVDETNLRCTDHKWLVLVVSVLFKNYRIHVYDLTGSLCFCTFTAVFSHVALVSDTPPNVRGIPFSRSVCLF